MIMIATASSLTALLFLLVSRGPRDIITLFHTPAIRSLSRFTTGDVSKLRKSLARSFISFFGPVSISLRKMGEGPIPSAYIALFVSTSISVLSYIMFSYSIVENNLISVFNGLHSAFDIPTVYQLTSVAWSGPAGELLLLFVFSQLALIFSVYRKIKVNGLIIPFLYILTIAFALIFIAAAQPFRSFPEPLKMGMGASLDALHWSRSLEAPMFIASLASLLYVLALYFHSRKTGELENYGFYGLILSALTAGLAVGLRISWNYQTARGGLWTWTPAELGLLSWATGSMASLGAWQLDRLIRKRPGFLTGVVLSIVLSIGLLSLQARYIPVETPNPDFTVSIYFALAAIVFLMITLHAVFTAGISPLNMESDNFIPSPKSKILGSLVALAFLFTLFAGVAGSTGAIPSSCDKDQAGRIVCHTMESPVLIYNIIAYASAMIFLILAGLFIAVKESISRQKVFLAGGASALLVIAVYLAGGVILPSGTGGPLEAPLGTILYLLMIAVVVFVIGISGIGITQSGPKTDTITLYGSLISLALIIGGMTGPLGATVTNEKFHYYLMLMFPEMDHVQYYSGDKAYMGNIQIESGDLFIGPLLTESAYKANRLKFTIAEEIHFRAIQGTGAAAMPNQDENQTPYQYANRLRPFEEELLHQVTGVNLDGRLVSRIIERPMIDPAAGEVIRGGPFGAALREITRTQDTASFYNGDLNVKLEKVRVPGKSGSPDLSHIYDYFFFDAKKNPQAYYNFFPRSLIADVKITLTPGLKFIWLGLLGLFFMTFFFIYDRVLDIVQTKSSGDEQ